ncbi:17690_t:CDS:2 [Entrophospora sp. SA101]|nr:17690_t:CDS:2 [Entrophospora sp. SA101]
MSDAYPEYIEEFSIEISDFCPIGPTCHIPLPETIPKRNNGVINMQNNDEWCFGWCVLGALHPVKDHPERNPHRIYANYINELNMEGIPVPVPVSTPLYQKFEENNPEISLCVYKWSNENKHLEFQYISERRKKNYKEVNLLVISEPDEIENPRSHYCIIKDIHRLVYNHSKHKERKYLCRYCLHVYSDEKGLRNHKCSGLNGAPQVPKVPKLYKCTKAFDNHKYMQTNPYRIFWDLECLTTKLTPEEDAQLTRTEKIQRHIPCGYSYVVIRMDSFCNYEITSYDLYRGPNALEKFVDKLELELADINLDLSAPAEMVIEPGDYTRHRMATECWICKKEFPNQNMLKTMVCCPNTGNYKGASHQGCKRKNEIIGPKWYQQPSIPDNGIFKEAYKCMYCDSQMLDQGEAVCLKPKMYSVLPVGHDPKTPKTEADFEKELEEEGWQKKHGIQKAKGVKKSVVKRELRHDKFLECLKTRKITRHDMYGLRSYDHQIYLERVNKIGLNPYDNKRWILSDGIQTLPYGDWRIRAYKKFVASGVIPEEAEKKAMKLTLKPEYQL